MTRLAWICDSSSETVLSSTLWWYTHLATVICFNNSATIISMWNDNSCVHFSLNVIYPLNSLRPRQNGRHFADDIFKRIFVNENVRISIEISLKFVPKGPINNNPALVQIMAWRRPGDKPLSEPVMVSLMIHWCVTRPQWFKNDHMEEFALDTNQTSCYYEWMCDDLMVTMFALVDSSSSSSKFYFQQNTTMEQYQEIESTL